MTELTDRIRQLTRVMKPQPTGELPVLQELAGIRGVLFDVYGTLLISGSGDIGAHAESLRQTSLDEAWRTIGLGPEFPSAPVSLWRAAIERSHLRSRSLGVDFPEVEIRDIWRHTLENWAATLAVPQQQAALLKHSEDRQLLERLAVEFEMRTNPVGPMPGAVETLEILKSRGLTLGLISNAQFYTPLVMEAVLGQSLPKLGLKSDLLVYSYQSGWAKPGRHLYEQSLAVLRQLGFEAAEILYVGNDMRNDIAPAHATGFRTCLFAGDARSLRQRVGDPLVKGCQPDLVITDWGQLPRCLPEAMTS